MQGAKQDQVYARAATAATTPTKPATAEMASDWAESRGGAVDEPAGEEAEPAPLGRGVVPLPGELPVGEPPVGGGVLRSSGQIERRTYYMLRAKNTHVESPPAGGGLVVGAPVGPLTVGPLLGSPCVFLPMHELSLLGFAPTKAGPEDLTSPVVRSLMLNV